MKRPYTICYMMTSIDGKIDCAMTSQLTPDNTYYDVLEELNLSATLCGRNTAELEMSLPGEFISSTMTPISQEGFFKAGERTNFDIIVDSRGRLLWKKPEESENPILIITSESTSKEYLSYLEDLGISWIAVGNNGINLSRAMEILYENFGVKRLGVVGGPTINTSFLKKGLLDEIVIMIGPGIDGRGTMPAVFDGLPMDYPVTLVKFKEVKNYKDGSVLIRYTTH